MVMKTSKFQQMMQIIGQIQEIIAKDCKKEVRGIIKLGVKTSLGYVPSNKNTAEATIEVTMAEVCAKFGKNVKIKKE